jgi:hypothetical protein
MRWPSVKSQPLFEELFVTFRRFHFLTAFTTAYSRFHKSWRGFLFGNEIKI